MLCPRLWIVDAGDTSTPGTHHNPVFPGAFCGRAFHGFPGAMAFQVPPIHLLPQFQAQWCVPRNPDGVSPSSKRKRRWLSRCGGFPAFQVPPTHFLTQFQAQWCVPRDSDGVSPGRQRQPNSLLPKSHKALPGVRCHPSSFIPMFPGAVVCPQSPHSFS
jgi:hypothetical protein